MKLVVKFKFEKVSLGSSQRSIFQNENNGSYQSFTHLLWAVYKLDEHEIKPLQDEAQVYC